MEIVSKLYDTPTYNKFRSSTKCESKDTHNYLQYSMFSNHKQLTSVTTRNKWNMYDITKITNIKKNFISTGDTFFTIHN
jgi:hypothetical protein